jgi:hypothetical protein
MKVLACNKRVDAFGARDLRANAIRQREVTSGPNAVTGLLQ